MSVPEPFVAVARSFFRAQLLGDRELLVSCCRPHPELASLLPSRPPHAAAATMLAEVDRLQASVLDLGDERHLLRAYFGGTIHLLVVHDTPDGPRVDPRYAIEALRPDDERRALVRRFYLALLLSDGDALRELSFDARGVELLIGNRPPSGEHGQLEHVAATMGIVQLEQGESFVVPKGIEFVGVRHAEMGIQVFRALTPGGEVPFLLRQRDGAWKVIPFHFIQSAIVARGGPIIA